MKFKKIIYVIIVCILFANLNVFASTKVYTRTDNDLLVPENVIVNENNKTDILNTPAVNSSEKVYDFAGVLTRNEEESLFDKINNFVLKTNIDLAIVTIKDNPINSSKDYAHNFYNYNYFKRDGVLLLIDFDEGGIYMVTSGSAYNLFPNSRMKPVLKNVYNKIMKKEFYTGCSMFVNSISGFVGIGEVERGEDVVIDVDGTVHKNSIVVQALVVSSILTLIIMLFLISLNRMVKTAKSSKEYLDKQNIVINDISDTFINSNTIKRRKNKS